MDKIKLIELANTWQGEGPDTGRQMLIARFKRCNLRCPYCDTQIKMSSSIEGDYTIEAINKALEKTHGIMITGGEPTFAENYNQTIVMLRDCIYQVANIETNGYKLPEILNDVHLLNSDKKIKFIYSPKVFTEKIYNSEVEKLFQVFDNDLVYLKIVVDGEEWSNKFIRKAAELSGSNRSKIYLMPLGTTPELIRKSWPMTIDLADELNLNLSSRLHIINDFT